MFNSAKAEKEEGAKSKGPLISTQHQLVLDFKSMKDAIQDQRYLSEALEEFDEIKQYLEANMFIILHKFDVIQPPSVKEPIVVVTEFQDAGIRHLYRDTKPIKNNNDLLLEMNKYIRQVSEGKTHLLPKVSGVIVGEEKGCCK